MAKTFIAKIALHRSLPRRCLWKQEEFNKDAPAELSRQADDRCATARLV